MHWTRFGAQVGPALGLQLFCLALLASKLFTLNQCVKLVQAQVEAKQVFQ